LLSAPLLSAPLLSTALLPTALLCAPLLSAALLPTALLCAPLLCAPLLCAPLLSAAPLLCAPLLCAALLSPALLSASLSSWAFTPPSLSSSLSGFAALLSTAVRSLSVVSVPGRLLFTSSGSPAPARTLITGIVSLLAVALSAGTAPFIPGCAVSPVLIVAFASARRGLLLLSAAFLAVRLRFSDRAGFFLAGACLILRRNGIPGPFGLRRLLLILGVRGLVTCL
jgi:hypothetical protein